MHIRFTKHSIGKFGILLRHGVAISRKKVIETVEKVPIVDTVSRYPLVIFQGPLDNRHVLRVICKREGNTFVVVTFYPGRKSQYEKK